MPTWMMWYAGVTVVTFLLVWAIVDVNHGEVD